MLDGCSTENTDNIIWDFTRLPVVNLSPSLAAICRRDKSYKPDARAYINREDIRTRRSNALTPRKLLAVVYSNPKSRFKLTFPVNRTSGHRSRRVLVPEIGIRAAQESAVDL